MAVIQAHEVGVPGPSHYSEGQAELASNNPGTVAERTVVKDQGLIKPAIDAAYNAVVAAMAPEPPLNLGVLKINFPPYQACH